MSFCTARPRRVETDDLLRPPVTPGDAPGFFVGANLPWIDYGCDFGANAWQADGGVARPRRRQRLRDSLARLADHGIDRVRWFALCDGRSGLQWDAAGRRPRLDRYALADADAALDELARVGMSVMLVLLDFGWLGRARTANGVRLGGRRATLSHPSDRHHLLEHVFRPFLQHCGSSRSVTAWDIINEPEWATFGAGSLNPITTVARRTMRAFIGETAELVHEVTPQPATVGLASARWLSLVKGLGLDFYQIHWYDSLERCAPLDTPVSQFGVDRPVLLGEFPTRGSTRPPSEILATAERAGYLGALAWSAVSTDHASDCAELVAALASFNDRQARAMTDSRSRAAASAAATD
jgi:hypothetical protein